jgi:hypothetical protein
MSKAACLSFIILHSYFIICLYPVYPFNFFSAVFAVGEAVPGAFSLLPNL